MDTDTGVLQAATDHFREAFGGSDKSPTGERRMSKRHDYKFKQWIAPCSTPDVSVKALRFFAVQCGDLSTSGMSFRFPTRPTFNYVVVRLGRANDPVHVLGEVVRSVPIGEAGNEYLVGCRFLRKLDCH